MKKILVTFMLILVCYTLTSCGSNDSNRNQSTEYYSYPAEEHYYTDPTTGLKYSKTSFFNPQYQTKTSNSGVKERYSTEYQEGYEEGYEDAKKGREAAY